jgi:hypothetical protein
MHLKLKDWTASTIWQELQRRGPEAEPYQLLLQVLLPDTQSVLQQAGTAPADFTLHDAQHAYRVAEIMAVLAGDLLTVVSPVDLAFMLMAAYGHDIGMTAPGERVQKIFQVLRTGNAGILDEAEWSNLRQWLDDAGVAELPLTSEGSDDEHLRTAGLLTAHYARSRHNDWSAEYLKEHWNDAAYAPFDGWLEEVIALCRSHHEGYAELRSQAFAPRLVDGGRVLHRRWCACILRMADVLDFDPERTPDIIFRHRDVSTSSEIFWAKDHAIHFDFTPTRVTLQATPRSAAIHKAVAETVEMVDAEMALCSLLADEVKFSHGPTQKPLPHEWTLEAQSHSTIVPLDHAYEYIEGAFRPDTGRILELLGGLALYRSSDAAIRELLQNAFDATRMEVALHQLEDGALSDDDRVMLERVHPVLLDVRSRDDGGVDLVCVDRGVGMSRETLRSRFLATGRGAGHRERDLARRSRAAGIRFERTARFGVGVLSYFLLADEMVVRSRPQAHPGEGAEGGWAFRIGGLDDFGELTGAPEAAPGTEVTLRLRSTIAAVGAEAFAAELVTLVQSLMTYAPCALNVALNGRNLLSLDPGWMPARLAEEGAQIIGESIQGSSPIVSSSASSALRAEVAQSAELLTVAERDIIDSLCFAWTEGEIPGGLGRYRAAIGYFERPDGRSLAFDGFPRRYGLGLFALRGETLHSWLGMAVPNPSTTDNAWGGYNLVRHRLDAPVRPFVWYDWTDERAVELSVSRLDLRLNQRALKAFRLAEQEVDEFVADLVASWRDTRYDVLNHVLIGRQAPAEAELWWPTQRNNGIEHLRFPLTTTSHSDVPLLWRGQLLDPVGGTGIGGGGWSSAVKWPEVLTPTHLGVRSDGLGAGRAPYLVYAHDTRAQGARPARVTVEFPPAWAAVVSCSVSPSGDEPYVCNVNHPVFRILAEQPEEEDDGFRWYRAAPDAGTLAGDPGESASWLAWLWQRDGDEWRAAVERNGPAVAAAVRAVETWAGGGSLLPVWAISSGMSEPPSFCRCFEADGNVHTQLLTDLPDPDQDFIVRVAPPGAAAGPDNVETPA